MNHYYSDYGRTVVEINKLYMKERLHYLDVCKGLLILMVIWQHIPQFANWASIDSSIIENCGGASWLFWGFYMQTFFLTNGYTSNFKKDFRPFFSGSFKALIIPYIAFALIGKCFNALLWGESDLWEKTAGGDQEWFFMEESYWFLSALFIARILYWFLCRYIKKETNRGIVAFSIMLLGFFLNHVYDGLSIDAAHFNNHLHYRNALCMMIFIWVGEYLKNHKDILYKYSYIISIVYIVFVIGTHLIGKACAPPYTHVTGILFRQIPLYIFYATSGSIFVLWLSKKINTNRVFEYLGRGSLVVYMTHFAYLRIVLKLLPTILNPYGLFSGISFYLITFILTAAFSAATIWVFNHKYLRLLIGKF